MAIDVERAIAELYPRSRFYTPQYCEAEIFPRMNELLSRILNEGAMADFRVFFDRVILPASENGAASDPALVDWRRACRDFAHYMDSVSYLKIVDRGWIPRFERPHVLWFFRSLLLCCRHGREKLIDRIVGDRRIAAETRALFCHAVFKAEIPVERRGRDFIGLPRFWHYNRSICSRIMDTKKGASREAAGKISVPRHGRSDWSAAMEAGVAGDNFAVFEVNREIEDRRVGDAMLENLIRRDAVRCFAGLLSHHPGEVFKLRSPEEWLLTVCRCVKEEFAVAVVNEIARQFPGIVGRARDPWGNTLLWNTFVNPNPTEKLRAELLRFGCDPNALNEWELSYQLLRDNDPKATRTPAATPPADPETIASRMLPACFRLCPDFSRHVRLKTAPGSSALCEILRCAADPLGTSVPNAR